MLWKNNGRKNAPDWWADMKRDARLSIQSGGLGAAKLIKDRAIEDEWAAA